MTLLTPIRAALCVAFLASTHSLLLLSAEDFAGFTQDRSVDRKLTVPTLPATD